MVRIKTCTPVSMPAPPYAEGALHSHVWHNAIARETYWRNLLRYR